ncbi:MAG: ABC transporter permease [Candidatus Methanofastidiosia archaeon]|jgi:ABC-2 type transport system permease protein
MNIPRLLSMTRKDIVLTSRESFFMLFIIMPIFVALVINAAFGSLGEQPPTVAVYGDDKIIDLLMEEPSVKVSTLPSEQKVRDTVLQGEYDAGVIVTDKIPVVVISGESLLNDRITIAATLLSVYRKSAGMQDVVTFNTITVGPEGYSLKARIVPFLVIMATIIGGLIISSSLIEEREVKTLNAVLVTPITPLEVILAKSLFGLFLGLILGIILLVLTGSLAGSVHLIVLFLVLGTIFTVGLGLMAGVIMDNITDLIARMKMFNIILLFPALVILFPQIPQWIAKFFPTYYYIHPILAITQDGAVWADLWWEAVVLIIVDILVLVLASRVLRVRMLEEEVGV